MNIKETLVDTLAEYYANGIESKEVLKEAGIIPTPGRMKAIEISQRGWDELPCDKEGATEEQDRQMTIYLNDIADVIIRDMD